MSSNPDKHRNAGAPISSGTTVDHACSDVPYHGLSPDILGRHDTGTGNLKSKHAILGKGGHDTLPPSHHGGAGHAPAHLKHPADGNNDKIPGPDPMTRAHIEKHACHLEGTYVVPKTHLKPETHVKGIFHMAKSKIKHIQDPDMKKELHAEVNDMETEYDKMKHVVKDHKNKEQAHKLLETELDKAHSQLKHLEAKMHKKDVAKKEVDAKKEEVKVKAIAVAKAEKDKKKAEVEVFAANHKMSSNAETVRKLTHVAMKTAKTPADAASAAKTHRDIHHATEPLKHDIKVKKERDFINYELVDKLKPLSHIDAKFPCMGFAVDDNKQPVAVKCAMQNGTCPISFDKSLCFVMKLTDFDKGLNKGY